MSNQRINPSPEAAVLSGGFIWRLVIVVLLINLFVSGMAIWSLYQSREAYRERAKVTTQNLSEVLAQNLDGTLDKIDLTLLAAADEIERQSASAIDRQKLNAFLLRQQNRLPEIISLRATDANGIVQFGQGVDPAKRQDNSDREYFMRQRDNPQAGLVITKPVFARIDKKWVVVMSRPIRHPDGSFGGVAYANVGLDYISGMFADLDISRHGAINLRDANLGAIVRYPGPPDIGSIIGDKTVSPEFRKLFESGQTSGTFFTPSSFDNVARTVSFRKITAYPLFISVGLAEGDYLSEWRGEVAQMSVMVAFFALMTVALSWMLHRTWQRQVDTAKELAQEKDALRNERDFADSLIETAQAIILVLDTQGRIVRYNTYLEKLSGYPLAEMKGKDWVENFLPEYERQRIRALFEEASSGISTHGNVNPILTRAGEERQIEWFDKTLKDPDGNTAGILAIGQDVTRRIEAENELKRYKGHLEEEVQQRTADLVLAHNAAEAANKELEDFSYSMSHDMYIPLRAIDGFSKILLDEHRSKLDDEGKRLLKVLSDNARRIGHQIDGMLSFLRMNKRKIENTPIDIAELAREACAELQAAAPARPLHLDIGELPEAWGDREMLLQVLRNLLSNAVKFSLPDTKVVIELSGTAGKKENVYAVKNYGVGFDMQYVDKLFRVFERVHPTGQFEGSGIGLAIVKRIITRHGGRVWAEGKVGEGATIYFALPVK